MLVFDAIHCTSQITAAVTSTAIRLFASSGKPINVCIIFMIFPPLYVIQDGEADKASGLRAAWNNRDDALRLARRIPRTAAAGSCRAECKLADKNALYLCASQSRSVDGFFAIRAYKHRDRKGNSGLSCPMPYHILSKYLFSSAYVARATFS